jgi:magnesium-transporting ATPase (P-type)
LDEDRESASWADVFARVAPETKLTLVSIYQKAGMWSR